MKRNLLFASLLVALLGLIIGCSEKPADDGNELEEIAAEFGGFIPTDEDPGFGDPEFTDELGEDEEYSDQVLLSPAVDSIIDDAEEAGTYALRIIWGSLEYDSTVAEITDWTGSLTLSRGAEIVRRTIRFERGQDYIVPRTDRKLIEFVSKTTVHNDGIFANLYIPPSVTTDSMNATEIATVTFATDPFSMTFNISDLASLDTIFYLDDGVNAVAVRAIKIYPRACPKGFLEGKWGRDSTGQGLFRGRWISQHGALMGHLRGRWGTDPEGNPDNIFYGKWIDNTGKFEGLLKGKYHSCRCGWQANEHMNGHGGGWFRGNFYDANRNVRGVLHGHYHQSRCDCDGRMGFFKGRWKTYCPEISVDQADDGMDG